MTRILKYPRTRHVEGSRLQLGDEDLSAVPFADLRGAHLVVEEKLDGANAALSFGDEGELLLQSRGHFLTGGPREAHFALFKTWAQAHAGVFAERLGRRYIVYGEWLYAKHTVFYDRLPHYFMEFDVHDRETGKFLPTAARRELLAGLPFVSVPVLHEGPLGSLDALTELVAPSLYRSDDWRDVLREAAAERDLDVERTLRETDGSGLAEGLYIKVEAEGRVLDRLKWVRAGFLQAVDASGGHWQRRPIIPNRLTPGVDLFGGGA